MFFAGLCFIFLRNGQNMRSPYESKAGDMKTETDDDMTSERQCFVFCLWTTAHLFFVWLTFRRMSENKAA